MRAVAPTSHPSDRRPDVLVADPQRLFAEVLAQRLRAMSGVGEVRAAWSVPQARALAESRPADVVLLDPALDGGSGLDLLALLSDLTPRPVVVVVSEDDDPAVMVRALALGARGWVSKEEPLAELWSTVGVARAGSLRLPATAWGSVVAELLAERRTRASQRELTQRLTDQQRQVLGCLLEGMTRAEVAAEISVSVHTVRTRVRELLHLLDVRSSPELVASARATGLRGRDPGHLPAPPAPRR